LRPNSRHLWSGEEILPLPLTQISEEKEGIVWD